MRPMREVIRFEELFIETRGIGLRETDRLENGLTSLVQFTYAIFDAITVFSLLLAF